MSINCKNWYLPSEQRERQSDTDRETDRDRDRQTETRTDNTETKAALERQETAINRDNRLGDTDHKAITFM